MPLVFMVGKLIDVIGRRRGAFLIFVVTAAAIWRSMMWNAPRWP